jgi:hypothetical protein
MPVIVVPMHDDIAVGRLTADVAFLSDCCGMVKVNEADSRGDVHEVDCWGDPIVHDE